MNIIVAGIGGVGGYFGGLLAKRYYGDESNNINFVARGQHLKEIQENGLKVIKGENQFTAKPNIATDNPSEIGIADLVIICTKSYDLENILHELRPCINESTVILPLLNGVDSKEKINGYFPSNLVLDGCVYIISRLKQAGVVENSGNIQSLYFGLDNYCNDTLLAIDTLFKEAQIDATLSQRISNIMWEKFIFLSPIATATSYYDKCIGEIITNDETLETTKLLIEEVIQLAKAKNIAVADDITEKTLNKYKALPFETTSSMHNDVRLKKSQTELQTLTGYVLSEGKKQNCAAITYSKLFAALEKKSNLL